MIVSLLIIIGFVLALIVYSLVKIQRDKKDKTYLPSLPKFSGEAKLYFDQETDIICRRCLSDLGESHLILRRRYKLVKDEQGVLRSRRLAFLYICNNCGYKSLDKPNKPE